MALTVLMVAPLAGAAGVLVLRQQSRFEMARRLGVWVAFWTCLAAVALWIAWDSSIVGVQFVERAHWVDRLGASYHVGVDGTGLAFVTLVTWIGLVAQVASWRVGRRAPAGLAAAMLVLEAAAIGTIVARDLLLFFVATEIVNLTTFALIGGWGRERRVQATTKFLIGQLLASSVFFVALVWLAWRYQIATGTWSFAIADLHALDLPAGVQGGLWMALALVFAIRMPLVPLHTWAVGTFGQAPAPAVMLIGGVVLPVSGYGLLRVVVPLLPAASSTLVSWLAVAGAVGVGYGAIVALAQADLRRLTAGLLIGHLSVAALAACVGTPQALDAARLQLLTAGLWSGGWLLVVGMLAERRSTTLIAEFGGLWDVTPALTIVLIVLAAASMALPGTVGFVAVSASLEAVARSEALPHARLLAGVAVAGVVAWSLGMGWVVRSVTGGAVTRDRNRGLRDLSRGEWLVIAPFVVAIVVFGLWPDPVRDLLTTVAPASADGFAGLGR